MKYLFLTLFALYTVFFIKSKITNDKKSVVIITPNSVVRIKGKTNINNFECLFDIKEIKNPVTFFTSKKKNKLYFNKAILTLQNSCFDCGGKVINKDFNELLNSNTHPSIFLNLKEIEKKQSNTKALIEVTIAGVSKNYTIVVKSYQGKTLEVSGSFLMNIKDFNLKPPKKMLGIIKVSEKIEVEFILFITEKYK